MSNEARKIPFVTFLLPATLKHLEAIAKSRNSKVSTLIREAVEIWLSEPEQEAITA